MARLCTSCSNNVCNLGQFSMHLERNHTCATSLCKELSKYTDHLRAHIGQNAVLNLALAQRNLCGAFAWGSSYVRRTHFFTVCRIRARSCDLPAGIFRSSNLDEPRWCADRCPQYCHKHLSVFSCDRPQYTCNQFSAQAAPESRGTFQIFLLF